MTLSEFHYLRYALEYKEIDEEYRLHKLAFLVRNAAGTKNVGSAEKPKEEFVFKDFKSFFDYEGILKELDQGISGREEHKEQIEQKKLSLSELAAQRNKGG